MKLDFICKDCSFKGIGKTKCFYTTQTGDYFSKAKSARQTSLSKDGMKCKYYNKNETYGRVRKIKGFKGKTGTWWQIFSEKTYSRTTIKRLWRKEYENNRRTKEII